jgi:hypothetical protein
MKQSIIAEQKEALEERRDEACEILRETRDERYRELLNGQREARHGLHARQEAGLDNASLLNLMEEGTVRAGQTHFHEAAAETTAVRVPSLIPEQDEPMPRDPFERDGAGMKSGAAIGAGIGTGLGFAALSFFDSIAEGLIGATPAPKVRNPEPTPPRSDPFDGVIAVARERERAERQTDEDEAYKKQRSYGE